MNYSSSINKALVDPSNSDPGLFFTTDHLDNSRESPSSFESTAFIQSHDVAIDQYLNPRQVAAAKLQTVQTGEKDNDILNSNFFNLTESNPLSRNAPTEIQQPEDIRKIRIKLKNELHKVINEYLNGRAFSEETAVTIINILDLPAVKTILKELEKTGFKSEFRDYLHSLLKSKLFPTVTVCIKNPNPVTKLGETKYGYYKKETKGKTTEGLTSQNINSDSLPKEREGEERRGILNGKNFKNTKRSSTSTESTTKSKRICTPETLSLPKSSESSQTQGYLPCGSIKEESREPDKNAADLEVPPNIKVDDFRVVQWDPFLDEEKWLENLNLEIPQLPLQQEINLPQEAASTQQLAEQLTTEALAAVNSWKTLFNQSYDEYGKAKENTGHKGRKTEEKKEYQNAALFWVLKDTNSEKGLSLEALIDSLKTQYGIAYENANSLSRYLQTAKLSYQIGFYNKKSDSSRYYYKHYYLVNNEELNKKYEPIASKLLSENIKRSL